MSFFQNLGNQLKNLWTKSSIAGRVVFIATALVSMVLVFAVGVWSSQPEYVLLANDLSPEQAREMVSKLEIENISSRLN